MKTRHKMLMVFLFALAVSAPLEIWHRHYWTKAPLVATTRPLTFHLPASISLKENQTVTMQLRAIGGAEPFLWVVSSGTLPQGVTLSLGGLLSGVPTQPGASAASIQVTDTDGNSASANANFTVKSAVAGKTVLLTWIASTSDDVLGYNVYRSTVSGGPYVQINGTLVTGEAYTDASLPHAVTLYYVVTAVDSDNVESAYSAQAAVTLHGEDIARQTKDRDAL